MRSLPLLALLLAPAAVAAPLVLDGGVPEGEPAFFRVPFEVPEGTREVEVRHSDLSGSDILDFGLEDPNGMRGWGGGNEEAAVVGDLAASRSYLAGPLPAGTWNVVIGKAKVVSRSPGYYLEIERRTTPRLAPQPERSPYVPVPPLELGGRWYSGDFHVHSKESGDARPTLDEVAEFAEGRVLDFVALTEHNTVSQLQWLHDAQLRHPKLLLVPSVEFTTYGGHATAFGATSFVDFRLGLDGVTVAQAADAFEAQGALFTLAHPVLDLGSTCIGCAWTHEVPLSTRAIEIASGGWQESGFLFTEPAIAYWDRLSKKGLHLTALGGSDDHRGGLEGGQTASRIGSPTTMVFAREKSVAALVQGVREGRTVVKLQGPADPMIDLSVSGGERRGDTVAGASVHFSARLYGVYGLWYRLVKNGEPLEPVSAFFDQALYELDVEAPESGEDFWRLEVLVDGHPRTVTSNVWITRAFPVSKSPKDLGGPTPTGCGCGAADVSPAVAAALLTALLRARRRARRQ